VDKTEHTFAVSLVQYTQEHTNLHTRQPGDRINLETDIIARYVEQFVAGRHGQEGAK
jgi:riboflavin synthase